MKKPYKKKRFKNLIPKKFIVFIAKSMEIKILIIIKSLFKAIILYFVIHFATIGKVMYVFSIVKKII